ncbi:MAG: F0F1 ATP synthase subunit A [Eubacteriales bacterium]|nr:F0F1 ATP synthase subunit A [Eubacteriales bacterium]
MERIAEELLEKLNVNTAFTIPIFGGIPVHESIVVSWIVMAVLLLVSLWLTHGMTVQNPGKRQLLAEFVVQWLDNFTEGMLGEHGKQYGQYIATVLMFIGLCNITGIFGMKPPAKDMNVTIALALMSIILIEAAGIRAKTFKGWLKAFSQPIAIVTPINILELVIRPLSLCMRLFGNVLGAYVIMALIEFILPVGLPIVFSLYFDIFDGFIQAYVFVFLTSLFIQEAVEVEETEPKKKKKKKARAEA